MAAEGIMFKTNCEIGKDVTPADLKNDYDAVLLATGSTWPRDLKLEGKIESLIHSFDSLIQLNSPCMTKSNSYIPNFMAFICYWIQRCTPVDDFARRGS